MAFLSLCLLYCSLFFLSRRDNDRRIVEKSPSIIDCPVIRGSAQRLLVVFEQAFLFWLYCLLFLFDFLSILNGFASLDLLGLFNDLASQQGLFLFLAIYVFLLFEAAKSIQESILGIVLVLFCFPLILQFLDSFLFLPYYGQFMTFFLSFDSHILHFLQLNKLLLLPLELLLDFLLILLPLDLHLPLLLPLSLNPLHLTLLLIKLPILNFLQPRVDILRLVLLEDLVIMAAGSRIVEFVYATLHFFNDLNIIKIIRASILNCVLLCNRTTIADWNWNIEYINHRSCNLPPLAVYISIKSSPSWFLSCRLVISSMASTIRWISSLQFCSSRSFINDSMSQPLVTVPSLFISKWRNADSIQDFWGCGWAWVRLSKAASQRNFILLLWIQILPAPVQCVTSFLITNRQSTGRFKYHLHGYILLTTYLPLIMIFLKIFQLIFKQLALNCFTEIFQASLSMKPISFLHLFTLHLVQNATQNKILMKEAHRVYHKHKIDHQHQSPFFKSSVQRNMLDPLPKVQPGPGSYEVTLPMVKPKYEAIFKNNRSIIIKVNDIPVPAFASREARFKEYSTIDSKIEDDLFDIRELEKQKYSKAKNSRRYNFSMARKKSNQNISSTTVLSSKYNLDNEPLKGKGPEWSKYREQRKIWLNRVDNPGPGAYSDGQRIQRSYIKDKKSWQFRSETKRSNSYKRNSDNGLQIPQLQQKINSIHSRHNLVNNQY